MQSTKIGSFLQVHSFPPLTHPDARILILGSMPGVASLKAGQYYAHPRNTFWRIMGEFLGATPELEYETRIGKLRAKRIAMWDVLKTCTRGGSLDSNILNESIVTNDFAGFFAMQPEIVRVCFNGAKAELLFHRCVLPGLSESIARIEFLRLPSTSPANAGIPFDRKLADWRNALMK